uniref:Transmembrane protein n=1 Tax=Meloidogyne hapla TaxID=6305 RepID=A0A1I8B559_MELHA
MSFRNRRKSSGPGSTFMSIRRRSSATQRDFELLMFQKKQRFPDWLLIIIMLGGPVCLIIFSSEISSNNIENELFSPSGPLIVLLISQLQLFFLWHIPAKELIQLTDEDPPQTIKHKNTAFESCILICLIYLFGALLNLYPGEL